QHSNIRMVSPARIPKGAVDAHRQRTILLSLMLAFVGGVGFVWLLDRLDDSIRNIDDVTRFTALPALAVIPAMDSPVAFLPYYYGKRRKKKALSITDGQDPKVSDYMRRARLMEFDSHSSAA